MKSWREEWNRTVSGRWFHETGGVRNTRVEVCSQPGFCKFNQEGRDWNIVRLLEKPGGQRAESRGS